MRKLALYIMLFVGCANIVARPVSFYSTNSMLRSGKAVRLQVSESGIYCLSYEQIKNSGVNPQKAGILGYGGALLSQDFTKNKIDDLCPVGIYINKGADGVFNQGDYILFYGQGSVSWTFNGSFFTHTRNHCSDYGYYFLSDADGAQRLMPTEESMTANADDITTYTAYALHEQELVNLLDIQKGVSGGGREFYGEEIPVGKSLTIKFPFDNIDTSTPMTCMVSAASTAHALSTVTVKSNSASTTLTYGIIETSDHYTKALTATKRLYNIPATNSPAVTISLQSESSIENAYLNYIEFTATCKLHLYGNTLFFRNTDHYGTSSYSRYCLTGADANTQIWDITRLDSIKRVPTQLKKDTLFFVGENSNVRQYVAVRTNISSRPTPVIKETVTPQNLHSLRDIDYVIITTRELYNEALRLAEEHKHKDGLTYAVVTAQEVYNEFSSGTPDVSAYRWLMKMLYDCASEESTKPKSLLLFGDGTFDNRKLLPYSGSPTLLTYQAVNSTVETKAYASDDYFGFLEDKDGVVGSYFSDPAGEMRIGVGRLPVTTQEEARQVVDKLIAYMEDNNRGKWKQQICFLADDGDSNLHTDISNKAAELVRSKNPNFIVNKIYLDAYTQETTASGETYPLAYNRFTNLMRNGVLFMDYSGHGSPNNITNELFLTKNDIEQMTNRNQAFWMLATCGFAHFDTKEPSAAELAVTNPNGGAIAVLSACRTVYANENDNINRFLCDTLFGHKGLYNYTVSIGEATRIAKNRCGKNSENKMSYILFGDPALRLNYPVEHDVVTTQIADTMRALQEVTINGFIRTDKGDTATYFNGNIEVSIYDKEQQITTRDNDAVSVGRPPVTYTYTDHPNLLFAGSTIVENGLFSLTFRMPKDIRYNYGKGRIVYYALDKDNQTEATGYCHQFAIGGSDPQAALLNDTTGPTMLLYIDNMQFMDGGKTSEYPHFYANIYDENGINTIGSGIGHDLLLVLDNDNKMTYTLNDYYTAQNGSYRQGQVSYVFPQLTEGNHRLTFRAWDLLNNSTTKSLNFTVVNGLNPVLYSVVAYPNPCRSNGTLNIKIVMDRPDDVLTTTLRIFNINGELLLSEQLTDDRTISFTPADKHLTAGVYVYHLECSTPTSGTSTTKGKLIIQ